MTETTFDPEKAVRFNLPEGSVTAMGGGRQALVPMTALEELARSGSPAVIEAVGRAMGDAVGKRVASRLGGHGSIRNASLESFVTHLAGELAVVGYGVASIERWGRALVVLLEGTPLSGPLLTALIGSTMEAASGQEVSCTCLMNNASTVRILVTSRRATERARQWLDAGVAWGDVLMRLHSQGGDA